MPVTKVPARPVMRKAICGTDKRPPYYPRSAGKELSASTQRSGVMPLRLVERPFIVPPGSPWGDRPGAIAETRRHGAGAIDGPWP